MLIDSDLGHGKLCNTHRLRGQNIGSLRLLVTLRKLLNSVRSLRRYRLRRAFLEEHLKGRHLWGEPTSRCQCLLMQARVVLQVEEFLRMFLIYLMRKGTLELVIPSLKEIMAPRMCLISSMSPRLRKMTLSHL